MKPYSSIFITLTLLLLVACSDSQSPETNAPQRIVVISPSAAEILDSLGLANRVVGRGQFGPWSKLIVQQPVVGGYDSPNVEQIIEMEADIVLNTKSQAALPAHRILNNVGIEVMELDTSTIKGVFETIERIGSRFDQREQARQLKQEIQGEIDNIKNITKGLPKRHVLFVVGRDPVYVAGPGSHIDFMINLVGGENIAYDSIAPYQQISLETILERIPVVIIDTSSNNKDAMRGRLPGNWSKWRFLPAVKNNEVHFVDPSQLVIPGIRIGEMSYLMGKLIHPEVFGQPDEQNYLEYKYINDDR